MPRFPRPVHLPFGTSLELVDPLDRDPLLTSASPVRETDEVLAWLQMAVAGDADAIEALAERGRELGFEGNVSAILTAMAGAVARGTLAFGSTRDVVPVVVPSTADEPIDDFEPGDTTQWSVFGLAWGQSVAKPGSVVELSARGVGVPDGVFARLDIMARRPGHATSTRVGDVASIVRGGRISASWGVDYPWSRAEIPTHAAAQAKGGSYAAPRFYFQVSVRGRVFGEDESSGLLELVDDFELAFVDFDASPRAERGYRLVLASGETREGRLAPGGALTLRNVAPGPVEITFERFPEEF